MSALLERSLDSILAPRGDESPPCLYCGNDHFAPLYQGIRDRLGHVHGEWSYVRCTDCGSAHLRPFPKAADLPAYYPPVYTFSPELATGLKRVLANVEYNLFFQPVYRQQVNLINRRVRAPGDNPGRLLDIGCGLGLRLLHFRQRGYEVHGMDFVPESVEYVQSRHSIPAVCTDIEGLAAAFSVASFDVITAFYVLEHVVDLDLTLSQCLKLLKPGGWFVGAVPLIDSIQARALGTWNVNVREAPRHISIPTQRAMRNACASAGFDRRNVELVPDPIMSCAGSASLSLVPNCSTTAVYGSAKLFGLASRLAGAAGVFALLPWMAVENHIFRRPVLGLVFAQRPLESV